MQHHDTQTSSSAEQPDHGLDTPWRGSRLGLPAGGSRSMASLGPRVLALGIDWLACLVLARIAFGDPNATLLASFGTLIVFFAEVTFFTWLLGASFGQMIVGIRVVGLVRRLGFVRVALRTALLCLVLPPAVWDTDGRGLHDRAVGSVVVRA